MLIPTNNDRLKHWTLIVLKIRDPQCVYLIDSCTLTRTKEHLDSYLVKMKDAVRDLY